MSNYKQTKSPPIDFYKRNELKPHSTKLSTIKNKKIYMMKTQYLPEAGTRN